MTIDYAKWHWSNAAESAGCNRVYVRIGNGTYLATLEPHVKQVARHVGQKHEGAVVWRVARGWAGPIGVTGAILFTMCFWGAVFSGPAYVTQHAKVVGFSWVGGLAGGLVMGGGAAMFGTRYAWVIPEDEKAERRPMEPRDDVRGVQ